jgi:hypothetical protein
VSNKRDELIVLKKTSPEQMWDSDLVELLAALDERDLEDMKEREAGNKKGQKKTIDDTDEYRSSDWTKKYLMDGDIVTVDIKPLAAKPQVWRKEKKITEEKKEIEVLSKALGVIKSEENGSLLERLVKKKRESDQKSMFDFLNNNNSKEPKLDVEILKPVESIVKRSGGKKIIISSDDESMLSDETESSSSSYSNSSGSSVKLSQTKKKRPVSSSDSDRPKKKQARKAPGKDKKKYSSSESDESDEDSFVVSDDDDDSDYSD